MRARAFVLCALASACAKDPTQLVVFVETDLAVPDELSMVRAIVLDDQGGIASEHTFPTTESPLPFSFGVEPGEGPKDQRVTIELEAIGPSGSLFIRRAVTQFVEEKTLLLRMFLAKHCQDTTCELGFTCTETGCASEQIPATSLVEIEPGAETRLDAGVVIPPDAGVAKATILVESEGSLTTSESGGTATFSVQLDEEPTSYVAIALSVSDPLEAAIDAQLLTFTPLDWNVPKIVVVTGLDDRADDGDRPYQIITAPAASGDPAYDGVDAADVSLTNEDDDASQINLIGSEGLSTTERGGTASFSIVLGSQPAQGVLLAISSSDPGEATVSTASIAFTVDDWDVEREVMITGVDDQEMDGPQEVTISIDASGSADPTYAAAAIIAVTITNADDEAAGVTVSPTAGLITTEAGGTAQFSVVLNTQPTGAVTIGLSSSNPGEATVSPDMLTFDESSWSVPQNAIVIGMDDEVDDGDVEVTILTAPALSADPEYSGSDPSDVVVVNQDDEMAGIEITPSSGLVTSERGEAASFAVRLRSAPIASVQIGFSSSDPSEGSVSASQLTFEPNDWGTPKIVMITGIDDTITDGAVSYTIITAPAVSTDPAYSGLDASDVSVTNADDDTAGITVSPTTVAVSEDGQSATFTVRLTTAPAANVSITLSSSDDTEGVALPASLQFTPSNWNVAQTVTVSPVDDPIADGDVVFAIVSAPASSSDPAYANLDPSDVTVTNEDDDVAMIQVSPTSGLITTESGGIATFTVRLSSQPTAAVAVGLSSNDTSEGTVSPASLSFTQGNWNAPQTVTVTGVNDAIDDGNVGYTIVTAAATSGDPAYAGLNPPNVTASNTDDDTAGITVSPTTGLMTRESGMQASFTIRLNSQPTANVVFDFNLIIVGEVTPNVSSLTFTPANWNLPQAVPVVPTDDGFLDGDQPFTILTPAAMSSDPLYANRDPPDVTGINADDGMLPPTPIVLQSPFGNGVNARPSISADGLVIAFYSERPDLVPNDTNGVGDIFVFARSTVSLTRVSVAPGGAEANGRSDNPVISADGRWVAFESSASNLVAGDNNNLSDVFLHDRMTGATTRIFVPGQTSMNPGISADGRYVPFYSGSMSADVHQMNLFDRTVGTASPFTTIQDVCQRPGISFDGFYVVFQCVLGNNNSDAFLFDRQTGVQSNLGGQTAWVADPRITPDGIHIGYTSSDDPRLPIDNNGFRDVFLLDRITQSFEPISVGIGSGLGNDDSEDPSLSDDAAYVAFRSFATNLGPMTLPNVANLFVRHRASGTTLIVTNDVAPGAKISGNGRFLVYDSPAADPMLHLVSRP